jgi:23S rRNA pseudouridine1911/1915/1917 synthase
MNIEILYESENFLVINKPAGVLVHGDGKNEGETVSDWFVKKYPEAENVGEPITTRGGVEIKRPGIVHRLDRDTSGVLILVKNEEAFSFMKSQFQEREVKKTYKAFVYGEVKEEKGTIDRAIGRSAKDFRLRSAQYGAKGTLRDAVTDFVTLKRGMDYSLLELYPKTGRTHQIRTHLKAINHPVVCDSLYAPKQACALGLKRLALHASKIEFTAINGENIAIESAMPEEFIKAKEAIVEPL